MKKLLFLSVMLVTVFQLQAQNTAITNNRQSRIIGGLTSTSQDNFTAADANSVSQFTIGGFSLGYEKFKAHGASTGFASRLSHGIGISTANYFGFSANYNSFTISLDWYEASKHYLSAYVFAEYDVKKAVTVGASAGPSALYIHAVANSINAVNPGVSAGKFSAGLHLKQYLQKYLLKNSSGQRTLFIRAGFEQFIMADAGLTAAFNLSLGF